MGVAASCLLTFAALVLIALATAKHHRQAFGRPPTPRAARALRVAGTVLLCAAPVPWMLDRGPTMSLVTWIFCGVPLIGMATVGLFTVLASRTPAAAPEE